MLVDVRGEETNFRGESTRPPTTSINLDRGMYIQECETWLEVDATGGV